MLGIIVQLFISWLIIWAIEKEHLTVLGLRPTPSRMKDLFAFMLLTALFSASQYFLRMYFGKEQWQLNPAANASLISEGLLWNLRSVLFEELIFRGVIFYILLKRIGEWKAVAISAAAFGIYHWFSFGVLGNATQMIFTFFITGIMGIVYALAYSRTGSLYAPIGIHFGWNTVRSVIFSESSIGPQLLIQEGPQPKVNVSYFIYAIVVYLPLLLAIVVNGWILLKRKKRSFSERIQRTETVQDIHTADRS